MFSARSGQNNTESVESKEDLLENSKKLFSLEGIFTSYLSEPIYGLSANELAYMRDKKAVLERTLGSLELEEDMRDLKVVMSRLTKERESILRHELVSGSVNAIHNNRLTTITNEMCSIVEKQVEYKQIEDDYVDLIGLVSQCMPNSLIEHTYKKGTLYEASAFCAYAPRTAEDFYVAAVNLFEDYEAHAAAKRDYSLMLVCKKGSYIRNSEDFMVSLLIDAAKAGHPHALSFLQNQARNSFIEAVRFGHADAVQMAKEMGYSRVNNKDHFVIWMHLQALGIEGNSPKTKNDIEQLLLCLEESGSVGENHFVQNPRHTELLIARLRAEIDNLERRAKQEVADNKEKVHKQLLLNWERSTATLSSHPNGTFSNHRAMSAQRVQQKNMLDVMDEMLEAQFQTVSLK